jgi:hypothetical protein
MPPYPLICYERNCGQPAVYKIAARWSDGLTSELKTYGLVCETCLPAWFRKTVAKQGQYQLLRGETLEAPGIYALQPGNRDAVLHRLAELEAKLR